MSTPVIGIDIGTTYCRVAFWNHDRYINEELHFVAIFANLLNLGFHYLLSKYSSPITHQLTPISVEIIVNEQGARLTPSYLSFVKSNVLVGSAAKQESDTPGHTVYGVKRLIGRRYSDMYLQATKKYFPFKIVESQQNNPIIRIPYRDRMEEITPEEVLALILAAIKRNAELYFGAEVNDAVLSVPSSFLQDQRQATLNAGIIAGFNVRRLVNESSAAALTYAFFDQNSGMEKIILLIDLGGGSVDVSLFRIEEGVVEVISTAGSTRVGGVEFDNRLIGYCAGIFKKRTNLDIYDNPRAIHRLRVACENAKHCLSDSIRTTIEIGDLYDGHSFSLTITRDEFEALNIELFQACVALCKSVLVDSKVELSAIADVILVGGSARIPKVRQLISEFLKKQENQFICRDEMVVSGAALLASVLSRSSDCNLLLIDVLSSPFGIECAGGAMLTMSPRNTVIPYNRTKSFSPYSPDSNKVNLQVYQGDNNFTKDNYHIGSVEILNIPPHPRGSVLIDVTYVCNW